MNLNTPELEVIVGSMYSGKSTELILRLDRAKVVTKDIILFKPKIDTRYSEDKVVTHRGFSSKAVVVDSPEEIRGIALQNKARIVGVDESQFFSPGLANILNRMVDEDKIHIIAAGLDLDFKGHPWPTMVPLMVSADSLTKARAVCVICKQPASRTQRLIDKKPIVEGSTVQLGGAESYDARCRHCFVSKG